LSLLLLLLRSEWSNFKDTAQVSALDAIKQSSLARKDRFFRKLTRNIIAFGVWQSGRMSLICLSELSEKLQRNFIFGIASSQYLMANRSWCEFSELLSIV
jgi:hypothetical protein